MHDLVTGVSTMHVYREVLACPSAADQTIRELKAEATFNSKARKIGT